jgi:hypothetical protein
MIFGSSRYNSGQDDRMRISDLKPFVEQTVTLRLNNGETAKVKVSFVDDESEDITAAVLETSDPEHYRGPCAMYTFAAADIVSAELLE